MISESRRILLVQIVFCLAAAVLCLSLAGWYSYMYIENAAYSSMFQSEICKATDATCAEYIRKEELQSTEYIQATFIGWIKMYLIGALAFSVVVVEVYRARKMIASVDVAPSNNSFKADVPDGPRP